MSPFQGYYILVYYTINTRAWMSTYVLMKWFRKVKFSGIGINTRLSVLFLNFNFNRHFSTNEDQPNLRYSIHITFSLIAFKLNHHIFKQFPQIKTRRLHITKKLIHSIWSFNFLIFSPLKVLIAKSHRI